MSPKRTREHVLAEESENKLKEIIGEWSFSKPEDYGIDGYIEIVDNEELTGKVFAVQLKATDSEDIETILNFRFNVDLIEYYHRFDLPVLLLRYSSIKKTLYYKWANSIDLHYAYLKSNKSIKVKFNENEYLSKENLHLIKKDIKDYELINQRFFNVFNSPNFIMNNAHGFNKPLLISLVNEILDKHLRINFKSKSGLDINITLNDNDLTISISRFLTITYDNYWSSNKNNIEILVNDILFALSILCFNKDLSLNRYRGLNSLIINYELSDTVYYNGLEFLIERGIDRKYLEDLYSVVEFSIYKDKFFWDYNRLISMLIAINDNTFLTRFIPLIIKNILPNILDPLQLGLLYYNLGNKYRTCLSEPRLAFKMFTKANKHRNAYSQESYFLVEMGNCLFLLNKYHFASHFFKKAFSLDNRARSLAFLCDSQMHEGKFDEALRSGHDSLLLIDSEADKDYIFFEIELRNYLLEELLKTYGSNCKILADDSMNLLEDSYDNIKIIEKSLRLNPLNYLAWFNKGVYYGIKEDYRVTLKCFLICAILNGYDPESICNAMISLFNITNSSNNNSLLAEDKVIEHLIIKGYAEKRQSFLKDMNREFIKSDFSEDIMINLNNQINEIIKVVKPRKKIVRLIEDGKVIEQLCLEEDQSIECFIEETVIKNKDLYLVSVDTE